jgi:hypothetical protein
MRSLSDLTLAVAEISTILVLSIVFLSIYLTSSNPFKGNPDSHQSVFNPFGKACWRKGSSRDSKLESTSSLVERYPGYKEDYAQKVLRTAERIMGPTHIARRRRQYDVEGWNSQSD